MGGDVGRRLEARDFELEHSWFVHVIFGSPDMSCSYRNIPLMPLLIEELLNQFGSMDIFSRLPSVIGGRIPFPPDSVLFHPFRAIVVHPDDSLHFPFGFPFDYFQWWF